MQWVKLSNPLPRPDGVTEDGKHWQDGSRMPLLPPTSNGTPQVVARGDENAWRTHSEGDGAEKERNRHSPTRTPLLRCPYRIKRPRPHPANHTLISRNLQVAATTYDYNRPLTASLCLRSLFLFVAATSILLLIIDCYLTWRVRTPESRTLAPLGVPSMKIGEDWMGRMRMRGLSKEAVEGFENVRSSSGLLLASHFVPVPSLLFFCGGSAVQRVMIATGAILDVIDGGGGAHWSVICLASVLLCLWHRDHGPPTDSEDRSPKARRIPPTRPTSYILSCVPTSTFLLAFLPSLYRPPLLLHLTHSSPLGPRLTGPPNQ
ncbi:hypothetical protein NMY22_g7586 [Coprinellus aureogranulatus]|nr:hypothetical protein NMY22_g7586 [Coprinellus aureogranulatus]